MIAESRLRTVGVVLAGGIGQRMGLNTPKQLLKIAGRTIIEHTLDTFDGHPEVDEVVVLMAPGFVDEAADLVRRNGYAKVTKILEGGASRSESTWRALQALGDEECDVLLHDAVRPFVEPRVISECVAALRHHEAVDVVIPSSDTVLVAAPGPHGETVREIPDRSLLRRGQTPQCFRLSVVREAYRRAFADPGFAERPATDDCGVVLRYLPDVPIHLVTGSEQNMKVTHPVDAYIADGLFRLRGRAAPALTDDECRRGLDGRTLVVFGGGHGLGTEFAEFADLAKGYGATVRSFSRGRGGVRVEDARAVEETLARVHAETGRIDHVVNVASATHTGMLADVGQSALAEIVAVDYFGPVTVARAALPYLAESRGHLLLCVSSAHTHGRAGHSLQASATAAVVNLAEALADEWAAQGVRVNCLNYDRAGSAVPVAPSPDSAGQIAPEAVARTGLDVLLSDRTGQVVDVRLTR
ncbi:bifunctional cytidylyltransferase/SDR family oxidoreductase [Planotetraspora kaengkrachanensis]|uniref:2-C-methyl-D-erythritol 4-phosphate cytidylyltransferase n=1 Tax=Planotetraspora kaengkrachanensis TaxID=575193 RepID=A0A8J3PV84_9ACTN|nr:bifunctional cytidylyltransferase/SDR family oxidoreductase [Planotetraspora kaengkrachanensis]GIG81637.1 pyrophosphorylase [Planotetraspora kaengkrachanensis]